MSKGLELSKSIPLPPIEPINDRVVVQSDIIPELTKGGIAMPNSAVGRRASRIGTVVAVGPGALRVFTGDVAGTSAIRFPMQTKVGDRVIVPAHGDIVAMDPDDITSELMIVPEGQLLAILR
jgi:co-chaperonin GroES (HSP10)